MLLMIFLLTYFFMMNLISVAFFTLLERNILSLGQIRKGPNKVGIIGLLQPLADGMKLFFKESMLLSLANKFLYISLPFYHLLLILFMTSIYPTFYSIFSLKWSILIFICLSSSTVYPIMILGWSSNSKFSLLGSQRSIAQTISYEVILSFLIIFFISGSTSFSFFSMNNSMWDYNFSLIMIFPLMLIWLFTILAETQRSPSDLPEGESELVSGFNVDYSSGAFSMISIAEYLSLINLSMISYMIFFQSKSIFLVFFMIFFFIWMRLSFPRIRYDHLMMLMWYYNLTPILLFFIFISFIIFKFF